MWLAWRLIVPSVRAETSHRADLIEIGFNLAKACADTLDVFRDGLIENVTSQDSCQERPSEPPSSRLNEGFNNQILAFRQAQLATFEVKLSARIDCDIAICEVVELA
ncbi:hypothetical protein GRI69_09695 [Erythrobacter vulgaris]|uniref:Uncharacterized protein n=1 Tax=Qipengyuania vulgaris TaxID=291985 RepID=A0A844XSD4_9SPHN|nr:hypothetical protein [Qipengyuania vulgaris]MXO48530.1 hypothetical protein [Qipengyuania vulgaris]